MLKFLSRGVLIALAAVFVVAAVAGCGGSGSSSSVSTSEGSTSESNSGGSETTASSGGNAATIAEAKKITQQYTTEPSAFPVEEPLPKPFPQGGTIAYLQCSAPLCAQLAEAFQGATKALGAKLVIAKAGASAQDEQTALSSLIEQKPSAVLIPGITPEPIATQLKQIHEEGIPIVSTGIMEIEKWNIDASSFGEELTELAGELQADWVGAHEPQGASLVFYTTPELDFETHEETKFKERLGEVCPTCSLRTTEIPIESFGSTAPSLIVSDLEANPDTDLAVFGANETTIGLPPALSAAGLETPFIGFGPATPNLQNIEKGEQEASLGLDFPVLSWNMVDQAARLVEGAPLSKLQEKGLVPIQWLNSENLSGDVSKGWTGYPDFEERYEELWQGK